MMICLRRAVVPQVVVALLCLLTHPLLAVVSADTRLAAPREVRVDLGATWNATSLVHEAAEWLGDDVDNPGKFFAFAEAMMPGLAHSSNTQDGYDAKECWTRLSAAIDTLVDGQLRLVAKVALASRQYSPRLETFRQLSASSDPGEGTCCWAVVNGETVVVDPTQVGAVLRKAKESGRQGAERMLDIDHIWRPSSDTESSARPAAAGGPHAPVIVMYGPMDSSCSAAMHEAILGSLAPGDDVTYMWRPIPFRSGACKDESSCSRLGAGGPLVVPGYGVELALKSTEYNAQDDRSEDTRGESNSDEQLASNPKKLEIRMSSFDDIGKHVLEKVAASDDGLNVLERITGDFPSMVDAISEVPVSESTKESVEMLASRVAPEAKLLLINGVAMNSQDLSWHGILEKIRVESEFMETLHTLGISREMVPTLVAKRVTKGGDAGDYRIGYRPTEEVLWLSDVEKDPVFESLSSDLSDFLEVDFMGQRQPVRRNLFTAIMLIDPSTRAGTSAIATASGLLRQGFPAKIGVVPVGSRNKVLTAAFVATAIESGPRVAADLFAGAAARVPRDAWKDEASYAAAMEESLRANPRFIVPSMSDVDDIGEEGAPEPLKATMALLERASVVVKRLGVDLGKKQGRATEDDQDDVDKDENMESEVIHGALLMNGAVHTVTSPSMWQSIFVSAWQSEGETIAGLVEDGLIVNESSDILGDILNALGSVPRLNPRILKGRTGLGIDATVEHSYADLHIRDFGALLDILGGNDVDYMYGVDQKEDSSHPVPVTHIVFVNSTEDALVQEARRATELGLLKSSRIGVSMLDSPLARFLSIGDQTGVLTNGRFLRQRFDGDVDANDFILLERMASKEMSADDSLLDAVTKSLSDRSDLSASSPDSSVNFGRKASDLAAVLSTVMTKYGAEGQVQPEAIKLMDDVRAPSKILKRSKFAFPTAPLQVKALFAPLSPAGQQLAPILAFLHESFHADVEVILNVQDEYSDLPLKSYYRYVTPKVPYAANTTGAEGVDWDGELFRPRAVVPSLPLRDILTLGMDVPESWLVSVVKSKHDLDNIQLDTIEETDVVASFRLDSVLFTGMALDIQRMNHPRGVQLELSSLSSGVNRGGEIVTDTLVMSNLGYFQLKANPGLWQLRLAEGASREIYRIKDIRQGEHSYGDGQAGVPVASFAGQHVFLLLERNKGQAGRSVLDGEGGRDQPSAPSSSVTKGDQTNQSDDTIHVFTVASGHMYERLQKIMILSAVKRSSRKLKFWFISNSISNQHREFIPIMAKQYGFEYEFITFKWPTWLHKQTDKQRIIWAYKILFLDVMFPLGLKKVIFCDSDQVIRADLAELWDLDLGGKPYGYVPMCGGNGEDDMDRYRFWKTGYWHEHLRGLPYHISALYVVDLQRFRAMAAGDQLRVVYDNLAKV